MFAIILALAAPGELVTQVVVAEPVEPMMPATDPGSWATNDDYPPAAMRDEREGTAGFRLTIAPDGLPQRCEIIASSGHADLDETTCRLVMERARFKPGRDEKGDPAGGTYANRIRWQIPDGHVARLASAGFTVDETRDSWPRGPVPRPAMLLIDAEAHYPAAARAARQEGDVFMAVSVDALGKVTGCSVIEGSNVPELDTAACALIRREGDYKPALDDGGKPAKGVAPAVFRWVLPQEGTPAKESPSPPPRRKFPMSAPASATMSVLIDAEGRASGCDFTTTGQSAQMISMNLCDAIGGKVRYIPFVDAAGAPVAKRVVFRTELLLEDAEGTTPGTR